MKAAYYDPMFYLCSEEMPFTISIDTTFRDQVDPALLEAAVRQAARRYPYFCVEIIRDGGEWLTVPNSRPLVVYPGPAVRALGSEAVNRHLFAVSYEGREVHFHCSHVITDGAGVFPFFKTIFYYYLSARHSVKLSSDGIRLADDPLLPGELENPYPEERMAAAEPFSIAKERPFFRLTEGGLIRDTQRTVYRVRLNEADVLHVNRSYDGSPCSIISSMMAKAIWELHPDEKRDIVSAVSFNMRPGLGSLTSYRMLCSAIRIFFPERLREAEIGTVCTCARGVVTLQSQPENVLVSAEKRRKMLLSLDKLPGIADKKAFLAPLALADATDNTFSVSYVGKLGLGDMEPYIDSIYNVTDGSTYRTLFIEVSSVNGWFDVAFLQGFSSDVYYRAFLRQLEANRITYKEEAPRPLVTSSMQFPE